MSKKGLALAAGKVTLVKIAAVAPDPNQPRRNFDKASLTRLADSIKARGVMHPIQVRPDAKGKIIILDGERRWRAAKQAGLKQVPVLLAEKRADATQIVLDQVAVNELRENLTQLDIGFVLRGLRDDAKKSPNEIAAHLAKNGMGAMARDEVDGLIALTYLPTWAHDMVKAGTVELKHLTPLVKHAKSKQVMEVAREMIADQVDWGGKATARNVESGILSGLGEAHQQLDGAALFDWKKICLGCPHLIRQGSSGFCTAAAKFKEKQAEAKKQADEKGRNAKVGGADAKPRQPTKEDVAERKKQRTQSLRDKAEGYLWAYLTRKLLPELERARDRLVLWAALKRPGSDNWDPMRGSYQGPPECYYPDGSVPEGVNTEAWRRHDRELHAASAAKIAGLEQVPKNTGREDYLHTSLEVAREVLFELPFREIQVLAHDLLGDDLARIWTLDAPFLELHRKGELAHLAKTHKVPMPDGVTDWESMKGGDLRAAILARPDLVMPKILIDLYAKVDKPEAFD